MRGASAGGPAAAAAGAPSATPPAAPAAPARGTKKAETPEEFDARIVSELRAADPGAVPLFEEANAARKAGDHAKAAERYARVYGLVPSFVHALRRQCWEESALGHREEAIAHCRAAVEQDASAENEGTLCFALLSPPGAIRVPGWKPTAAEMDMAAHAVDAGIATDARGSFIWTAACEYALAGQDFERLRACVDGLRRVAPEEVGTHVYASILAATEERWADAEKELDRAHDLGLDEETYRSLRGQERSARPLLDRFGPAAALVGGIWLAGLLLLLGAAWILSRITLRAVSRIPAEAELAQGGEAKGVAGSIRSVYRVVLWLCCAYYYVSLPLVFLGVLALGGGLLYGSIAIGHVPVKLIIIVAVVTLGTLWAIVRSLFVRGRDVDPGLKIELHEHPKLARLLEEVALAVGTRPVDSVYLTPGTTVAVMERGRMIRQLAGARERCLILGAGVLEGMRLGPLKAVLAHEYGHLTNRDTAGGGFALAVRRSLHTMAQSLASSGAAAWYNPAWLFLNGFYRVFLRISQGASRLQEVLADRWAAKVYGAAAFEEGLRHVVAKSVRFNANVGAVLDEVMKKKTALWNVYEYKPEKPPEESEVAEAVRKALERPASPYDSHPSPADRFRWIGALPSRGSASTFDDAREAWSLFADRDFIERRMTAELRKLILMQNGIEVPPGQAGGWTPPGPRPDPPHRA